jgi:hypothetical protein
MRVENSTKNGVQKFHPCTRTCDTHLQPDGPTVPALGGQLHQEGETTALCTQHNKKIRSSVADPDPGSGAFLTPGSGMGRKSAFGSGIRDEQPGSYFLELRNHFFGVKILKFFDAYPGSRMEKKSDPGSGINIPDPQH